MKKVKQAVSVLILKNNKFLLLKEKNSIWWMPPGGKVEKNETLKEALRREIFEETGLRKIKIIRPINYWFVNRDKERREGVCFLCFYQDGKIKLSNEHKEFKWATLAEIKKLKITHSLKDFEFAIKIFKLI